MDELPPPANDTRKTPEASPENRMPQRQSSSSPLSQLPDSASLTGSALQHEPAQQISFTPAAGSPLPDAEILNSSHASDDETIAWTASEFIAHHKSAGWYGSFALAILGIAALVFLLTKDWVGPGAVVLVGISLIIFGARQPRQLQYALSGDGLLVANKYFPLDSFRSFTIIDEGAFSSIVFMPLKRFGQFITVYFDPHDEEKIINLLASRLPLEDKDLDVIDQLMKRLRF